ncbi:MAG: acyl-CoA dehydrogenase family protein [Thermoanaerobaculaceae bacterium]|nr:acyl-CoA dehydrogenase family protein [Thermoanaerobaculaceae bacterium]NLH12669.1 acyl-CoA dehydrogenase [Holophagae bacterium]HPW55867.1 acyl-CoA dehydrogenase family protein [Thermoanaerobaculaceae bacterium]
MDFQLTDEQQMIRDTVREFAEQELAPGALERDIHKQFARPQWDKLAALGFMGMTIEEAFGGTPLDAISEAIVIEELSRCDAAFGVAMAVHSGLTGSTITAWGTDEQKALVAPKLASGEWIAAYSLSEAGAGSDATAITCKARLDGDDWVLDGSKLWVTNGNVAGLYIIFARSHPDAPKKAHQASAFIVLRDTPGLRVSKVEDKLGIRASDTAELVLENVRVPRSMVLGGEGNGFKVAFNALDISRIGIAAQALGIAQGAFDFALEYAKQRVTMGAPIIQHESIANYLADMATRIDAARLLVYRAAWMKQQGLVHTKESSMAKLYAGDTAMFVADRAVQILGGYGYTRDFPVERYFRDAKITQIYEGTQEMQRLVIARALAGTVKGLTSKHA